MSEEKALLRAIVEDPDDDTVRLAYADWLEEQGGDERLARAEFIRVQMSLSRMADDDPARTALVVREARLLNTHRESWQAPVKGLAREFVFRRGFVDEVSLPQAMLVGHGNMLLDRAPVTLARVIGDGTDNPRDLARWPGLRRVRGLDLSMMNVDQPGVRDVFQSPAVGGLRRLDLGQIPFGLLEGGKWLREAAALHSLRELSLTSLILTDEGFEELTQAPWFARLTRLGLAHNRLTAAALEVLIDRRPPGLAVLDLTGCDLGRDGVEMLARSRLLAGLKELTLNNNVGVRAEGLAPLVGSPFVEGLEALSLRNESLGLAGARLLAESPRLGRLTRLRVQLPVRAGDEGLAQLAESRFLKRLSRLDLSGGVRAEGVARLAASRLAGQLTHLDLSGCDIRDKGVMALARSSEFRRLTHLNLAGTRLGGRGVAALAESPVLANVVELDLRDNALSANGVAPLAASPRVGPQTTLVLNDEFSGKKALRAEFPGRVEFR